ncbi:hypothetical protein LguiA_002701 [Lonicera macranthoides]
MGVSRGDREGRSRYMAPVKKQKVEERSTSEEEKLAMAEDDDDEEYEDEDDGYEEQKAPPGYERGRYSDDSDIEPEDYKHPDYLYYMQRIRDSNGFDVPPRPKGLKVPYYVARCEDMNILATLSIQAINYYNKLHGTNYVYDSAIMGNCQGCAGLLYRITFRAIDTKEGLGEFQAIVFDGIREMVVEQCTLKPKPPPDSSASCKPDTQEVAGLSSSDPLGS